MLQQQQQVASLKKNIIGDLKAQNKGFIDRLSTDVAQHDRDNRTLEERVSELQQIDARWTAMVDSLQKQIEMDMNVENTLRQRVEQMEAEKASIEASHKTEVEVLQAKKAYVEASLTQETEVLQAENYTLKQEMEVLQAKMAYVVASLTQEMEVLQAENHTLKQEMEVLQAEKAIAEAFLA